MPPDSFKWWGSFGLPAFFASEVCDYAAYVLDKYQLYVNTTITYWRFRVKKGAFIIKPQHWKYKKVPARRRRDRKVRGRFVAELIAFFSRRDENYVNGLIKVLNRGNTETVASILQRLTGAELFQIEPVQPYAKDYNECIAQAQEDQRRSARPELKAYPDSISGYDTIYLGYPNYWGTMPMAVFTFLEHFDFSGKTIRPFCTHEGSGFGNSLEDIRKACPGAKVEQGIAIRGGSAEQCGKELEKWI